MFRVQTFHFPPLFERYTSLRYWRSKRKRILGALEALRAREEGGREIRSSLLFSPARGLAPKFPSLPFPFERLSRRLAIIKLSYYHTFIFTANCHKLC